MLLEKTTSAASPVHLTSHGDGARRPRRGDVHRSVGGTQTVVSASGRGGGFSGLRLVTCVGQSHVCVRADAAFTGPDKTL